jgi:hypothetical protein
MYVYALTVPMRCPGSHATHDVPAGARKYPEVQTTALVAPALLSERTEIIRWVNI